MTRKRAKRICDACGKPIPPKVGVFFSLGKKVLAKMCFTCHVRGCVWAAKMSSAKGPTGPQG